MDILYLFGLHYCHCHLRGSLSVSVHISRYSKIKRRSTGVQIEKNFITENVEEHIDRIHEAVKNIMNKYAPNQLEDDK